MLFITDIYGEYHTKEDRDRIERLIMERNKAIRYDYILSEEIGSNVALTKQEMERGIDNRIWGISPRTYKLGIKLGIPVIGIDDWEESIYKKTLAEQFLLREKRMVDVINEYSRLGNCAVIVGDTHLRSIETKELGKPSKLHLEFSNHPGFTIYRSPLSEIK